MKPCAAAGRGAVQVHVQAVRKLKRYAPRKTHFVVDVAVRFERDCAAEPPESPLGQQRWQCDARSRDLNAAALLRLLSDSETSAQLAASAKQLAWAHYNLDAYIGRAVSGLRAALEVAHA